MDRLEDAANPFYQLSPRHCSLTVANGLDNHGHWRIHRALESVKIPKKIGIFGPVVLSKAPGSLTWLKAAVYSGLGSAGCGGGRNWAALWRQKGVGWGHCGATAGPVG